MQQLMGPELPLSPDVAPYANRHKLEALSSILMRVTSWR